MHNQKSNRSKCSDCHWRRCCLLAPPGRGLKNSCIKSDSRHTKCPEQVVYNIYMLCVITCIDARRNKHGVPYTVRMEGKLAALHSFGLCIKKTKRKRLPLAAAIGLKIRLDLKLRNSNRSGGGGCCVTVRSKCFGRVWDKNRFNQPLTCTHIPSYAKQDG